MRKIINFFKSVGEEIRLITWPNAKQTRHDTWVVISTSILYGLYLTGIDIISSKFLKLFAGK